VLALALVIAAQATWSQEDAAPSGLWLSADVGAGVVDGDVVAAPAGGVGIDTEPVTVHLRLPVTLRAWDLPPLVPPSAPAGCKYVRCSEWLDDPNAREPSISPAALSRIVDEARLFHPGDPVYARAGGLLLTLGHGQVVSRYTNAAEWDRRRSGAYVEGNAPFARAQAQAFLASALQPLDLLGARVSAAPMAPSAGAETDTLERFLGRMRVGLELASDPFAPTRSATTPIFALAADLTWPLLDDGGSFQLAPWLGGSSVRGLAGSESLPSFGAAAGVDGTFDIIFVALHLGARATVDAPGHRSAVFGTLYDIDRRRMVRAGSDGFYAHGAALLQAPGGLGGTLEADAVFLRAVKTGARLRVDPVPEFNELEVGVDVAAGGVLVGARVLERAFAAPADVVHWGPRTFAVLEGAWAFYPPFSAFVRVQHALRFHDDARGLSADDDFLVGVRFDLVLAPG
jgi:hypothetical protein